ncbi:RICIN domain-containing protein [Aquimarina sp. RZ0]|uniref:RICIN domain-containing protein n=1 Tax=Aquimarina sp. RZ0 TaxID=2607730 RepID=UPI0011F31BE5|nr:RICIN domain-containing protein [Aquimarina sp. RZ0]KAA1247730.1 c-type cytochrome [Aquimarina sp. RZ0]
MRKKLIYLFILVCVHVQAQLPNQSYTDNELSKIISPQMSRRHFNQPSVISGHVVFAGNAKHEIWNISDPYNPVFVSEMISRHASGEAESHQVSYMKDNNGKIYLVTISGKGIDIWDVNDIKNPKYLAALELPGIDYGDVSNAVWGVSCQGSVIYVGATNNGLYVINAKNKSNPVLVKKLSTTEIGGIFAGPLFNIGNLLVITTPKNRAGIATLDISDSFNPVLLDSYKSNKKSYIGGFYGKHATLITPFRAIDVTTDPSNIKVVNEKSLKVSEYVSYDDGYLFLGGKRGGTEGIWKYDISDISNPRLVSRIKGRDRRWDDQFSCPIGNIVVVADDQNVGGYVGGIIAVHDTKRDTKAPEVIYVNPTNESIKQSVNSKIGISFSSWINFNKINNSAFKVRKVDGAVVEGTFGWTYTTVTFEPSEPLEANTQYEVILETNGIEDLVGNKLTNRYRSTFTTKGAVIDNNNIAVEKPNAIRTGEKVSWKIVNPNPAYEYRWDAGNGEEVTGIDPDFSYEQPGRYNVVLSAFGNETIVIEVEDGEGKGGVRTGSSNTGYSGSGYHDFPSSTGANVFSEVKFNAATRITGELRIRYAMGASGNRPLNLSINDGVNRKVDFLSTGSWSTYKEVIVPNVTIPAGEVSIKLSATAGSQGGNIDSFKITRNQSANTPIGTVAFTQIVNNSTTTQKPKSSNQLVKKGNKIWVTNEDANTITSISESTLKKVDEIAVGKKPIAISDMVNNRLWVLNKEDATISIINASTAKVVNQIRLARGSKPSGLIVDNNFSKAYVSSESLGKIFEISIATISISNELQIATDKNGILPKLGALALDAEGNNLYVTRLVSEKRVSEIYKIPTTTFNSYSTISLKESTGTDGALFARGIPNYLTHMAISPDGKSMRVASKKDNIKRGLLRDGLALEHDNTVRAITSFVNLDNDTEVLPKRLDIDNTDRCHSVTYSDQGDIVFIAMPGNNEIFVADDQNNLEVARLKTQETPTYTLYDPDTKRLYVYNFLGRSVSVFDVEGIINGGSTSSKLSDIKTVSNELLTAQVLKGKKLFYDATSSRLTQEGYMACASCHLDGGGDGQIWDISNLGEGFRNTIDLRGKGGTEHGRLHWTGNFDEVHDFENQIRTLNNGTGLLSDQQFANSKDPLDTKKAGLSADLDALAAYITSLNTFSESPYKKSNGDLTTQGQNGQQVFNNLKCYECHSGKTYTRSSTENYLYDVGTISPTSGKRIGKKLLGIDVPTLKGLWATAPYLHDGSAATIRDVLTTKNPDGKHVDISELSASDMNDLIAYLKQLDDSTPAALDSSISIAITAPTEGQQFDIGDDITLTMSSNFTNVKSVEYYINDELVATKTTTPFNYLLENAAAGKKEVIIKVFYGKGTAVISECVEFNVGDVSSDISSGTYYIQSTASGQYVFANTNDILMVDQNTSDPHRWKIEDIGGGKFTVQNEGTGRYLTVKESQCEKGADITPSDHATDENTQWFITKIGENYFFRPAHCTSQVLDKRSGNDKSVHTWDYNINNGNQQFTLIPVQVDGDIQMSGIYYIRSLANSQHVIAPGWDNFNVRMNEAKEFNDQKWEFTHIGGNIHTIKNIGTSRYLEVQRGLCEKGANINSWTDSNSNHKKWFVTKKGDNYYLRPVHCKNFALDKNSGNSGNVHLWEYSTANTNQGFELVPVNSVRATDLGTAQSGLVISPNPARYEFRLDLSNYMNESIIYSIINITGHTVAQGYFDLKHNDSELINVQKLQYGMYILKVRPENAKGIELNTKFIKIK